MKSKNTEINLDEIKNMAKNKEVSFTKKYIATLLFVSSILKASIFSTLAAKLSRA